MHIYDVFYKDAAPTALHAGALTLIAG